MLVAITVFIIPTLILALICIFFPVYKEVKIRQPRNPIVKHYIVYFLAVSIISALMSPALFYVLILGDCSEFRYRLSKNLLELK
jgi:hypothetical protein